MKTAVFSLALLALVPAFAQHQHMGSDHQAEIAKRGAEVMPFDLAATTHVFTKMPAGGIQQVVVKDSASAAQVALVRRHLRDIEQQFRHRDFSGPAHIHGDGMPGLAQLRAARPGQLSITYRDLPAGAELEYRSQDERLVTAIHQWFDAQLADHGPDARPGPPAGVSSAATPPARHSAD